jgi:YfiH family protein
LNLGYHVGDDASMVAQNRELVRRRFELPSEPHWLRQVHGCKVADSASDEPGCEADAVIARRPGKVCAVLTADCLPLLLCDPHGSSVAAVHAGWRGLVGGVVEATVGRLGADPRALLCWLGPAIGPGAFEVGAEVRERFLAQGGREAALAFRPVSTDKWLADLYLLARLRLSDAGVRQVYGGGLCTYGDSRRFYSYRRDGITGRMASLIWIGDQ